MNDRTDRFVHILLWGLPVWALMLVLGTLTHEPDTQTRFGAWARYVTTGTFLASHLINSIVGAAVGSLGFVGLAWHLSDTRAQGRAMLAMVLMVVGNTITAAVFGVAAFAQPALGRAFLGGYGGAQTLYTDVYGVPLFASVSVGLLLFMAGGVLAGLAATASGRFPRWPGWLIAVAVPVFALSNIFLPAALQTLAGIALVGATVTLAWSAGREGGAAMPMRHVPTA